MPDTEWDYDPLWQKSKLFIARATDEDRSGATFALWSILALETLARATLAKVHPALLADPREGANIMYAFGYGAAKNPRSISMSTVLKRCQVVIPTFTEAEVKFAVGLIERRNAELHTGKPAFEDLPTHLWLARYYSVVELLLDAQGRSLEDLLGESEAAAAAQMIAATRTEIRDEVFAAIRTKKHELKDSPPVPGTIYALPILPLGYRSRETECPACNSAAVLIGEVVGAGKVRVEEDQLVDVVPVLPTSFACQVCQLGIEGHTRLHAVDMGGQFTVEERYDIDEYYGVAFDAMDYMEPEYGND